MSAQRYCRKELNGNTENENTVNSLKGGFVDIFKSLTI